MYPLMFVLNPFFNWYYMVYGIFTAGQRTWGGPRADAATADDHTTPREAIEQAEEQGDELNIIPETFQAANGNQKGPFDTEEAKGERLGRKKSQVRPPKDVDGKFSARRRTAGGIYAHTDEIESSGAALTTAASMDSMASNSEPTHILGYVPRSLEARMSEEDRRKYAIAQSARQLASQGVTGMMGRATPSRLGPRLELASFDGGADGRSVSRNHRYARVMCGSSSTGIVSSPEIPRERDGV